MKIHVTLTKQERIDILTDTVDTDGFGYWARILSLTERKNHEVLSITIQVVCEEDTEHDGKEYLITPQTVQTGINVIMGEGFQIRDDIRANILALDIDSDTCDCIVQAGLFGEIVYS